MRTHLRWYTPQVTVFYMQTLGVMVWLTTETIFKSHLSILKPSLTTVAVVISLP